MASTKRRVSHYEHLRRKWISRHRDLQTKLWDKHREALSFLSQNTKQLAAGSLGALMLLSAPSALQLPQTVLVASEKIGQDINKNLFLVSDLASVLPHEVRSLTPSEEKEIAEIFSRYFRLNVSAELGGKRLNRSYGLIGQEQHLARYPGDTIYSHFDTKEEKEVFGEEGMAPGRGAWGYFAPSKAEFSKKDAMREKYYIAVQTFSAPGFYEHVSEYRDFFKYRKMLVVNPENGRGVVTVIGDAGPATWTGKHLGGSPEVMKYLERVDGRERGPVLYFFIDDPEDEVPLGPIIVQ